MINAIQNSINYIEKNLTENITFESVAFSRAFKNFHGIVPKLAKKYGNVLQTMPNNYNLNLFLGHLVIEKLLKAVYAKNHEENPYTIKK